MCLVYWIINLKSFIIKESANQIIFYLSHSQQLVVLASKSFHLNFVISC